MSSTLKQINGIPKQAVMEAMSDNYHQIKGPEFCACPIGIAKRIISTHCRGERHSTLLAHVHTQ